MILNINELLPDRKLIRNYVYHWGMCFFVCLFVFTKMANIYWCRVLNWKNFQFFSVSLYFEYHWVVDCWSVMTSHLKTSEPNKSVDKPITTIVAALKWPLIILFLHLWVTIIVASSPDLCCLKEECIVRLSYQDKLRIPSVWYLTYTQTQWPAACCLASLVDTLGCLVIQSFWTMTHCFRPPNFILLVWFQGVKTQIYLLPILNYDITFTVVIICIFLMSVWTDIWFV